MPPVQTYVLTARTRRGRMIELGHVNSLEQAARLERAIEDCLGEGFASFETVEIEEVQQRASAVSFEQERQRLARRSS